MSGNYSKETILATVGRPYIKLDNQGQKKILNLTQNINYLGRDPKWANMQVPREWKVVSRRQAIIVKEGNNFRLYDGDRHSQKPSGNGIFINQLWINLT